MKKFVQNCKKESSGNFIKEIPVLQGLELLTNFDLLCPMLSFYRFSVKQKKNPSNVLQEAFYDSGRLAENYYT